MKLRSSSGLRETRKNVIGRQEGKDKMVEFNKSIVNLIFESIHKEWTTPFPATEILHYISICIFLLCCGILIALKH